MSAFFTNLSTASFVAPDAPAGAPPIKVTLERKKKAQEVRRVRGDFAFDELVSVVRHMWNSAPKRLAIEYVDDDGDRVVIGSQLEWAEAQRLCAERGDRVIRLFARAGRSKRGGDAGGDSDVSDVEDVDATPAVAAPAPAPAVPAVPALPLRQSPADAALAAPAPAAAADEVTLEDDEEQNAHEATVDLLSRLFDCDAAQELTSVFSIVKFSTVATRKVDLATQSVHVDINRAKLRALTIDRTNAWIGYGLYEKAESTLAAATRVWPGEPIFEYNAACSAALRGDVPLAEQHLLNAIQLGFRDASLLREDADLGSIRAHADVFERVTSALERAKKAQRLEAAAAAAAEADAQRQTSADTVDVDEANSYAASEVDDVTADADDDLYVNVDEAEPSAPAPAPQPAPQPEPAKEETDVDKLVAVFPQLTHAEAAAMLRRFGTLALAVQHCLVNC